MLSNALNRIGPAKCSETVSIINTRVGTAHLFFVDGDVLYSREGTTQGGPLAMPFHAIATIPLIKRLHSLAPEVWYADDTTVVVKLTDLRWWWDDLTFVAPGFGYFPNASKTWLVVKDGYYEETMRLFAGTNGRITTKGRPHLGALLGSLEYRQC